MEKNSWVKNSRERVVGHRGRDRPQKTLDEVIQGYLKSAECTG